MTDKSSDPASTQPQESYTYGNDSMFAFAAGRCCPRSLTSLPGRPNATSMDMGARRYGMDTGRFLQEDMLQSSLGDLGLSTDPLSQNRYALAGGNPVSNVEIDGHMTAAAGDGGATTAGGTSTESSGESSTSEDSTDDEESDDEGLSIGSFGAEAEDALEDAGDMLEGAGEWISDNPSAAGHLALDLFGLLPGVGEPADMINAAWYAAEGDYENASLSLAASVPGAGYAASAVKFGKYAEKGFDAVETAQDATTAARTASKFCSFGGRTRVVMGDGSRKAISKVRVGDRVQARDPQTGQRVAKPVVALFVHPDLLVKLRIGKQVLTTTVDHRFWNSDAGRYQRADRLIKGDRVLGTDGRLLPVKGIRAASGRIGTAYNFEVADIHTYQSARRVSWSTTTAHRPRVPALMPQSTEVTSRSVRPPRTLGRS